ncbi:MAG TPA: hypothetical protein VKG44_10485, partial [Candidatus Baltobacteraceae bacterium]|nr:hypothetical protein [Candidatus Baltobacteraceae bacterium]
MGHAIFENSVRRNRMSGCLQTLDEILEIGATESHVRFTRGAEIGVDAQMELQAGAGEPGATAFRKLERLGEH